MCAFLYAHLNCGSFTSWCSFHHYTTQTGLDSNVSKMRLHRRVPGIYNQYLIYVLTCCKYKAFFLRITVMNLPWKMYQSPRPDSLQNSPDSKQPQEYKTPSSISVAMEAVLLGWIQKRGALQERKSLRDQRLDKKKGILCKWNHIVPLLFFLSSEAALTLLEINRHWELISVHRLWTFSKVNMFGLQHMTASCLQVRLGVYCHTSYRLV